MIRRLWRRMQRPTCPVCGDPVARRWLGLHLHTQHTPTEVARHAQEVRR